MAPTKAVSWRAYGSVDGLQVEERVKPTPGPREFLIRVRATGVTAGDSELRALRFGLGMRLLVRLWMGWARPRGKILGQEYAGDVEAAGAEANSFRVGDAVYGTTGFSFGAYAEFLLVREGARDAALALKPTNVSYGEAATIPTGGLEALHLLRKAGDLRGRQVLVNGAGGGIGSWAVQLAKLDGAVVTGVDTARKLELLRSLGADHVVDGATQDFTDTAQAYDIIFDVIGNRSVLACLGALRRGGSYLVANPSLSAVVRAPFVTVIRRKRMIVRGSRPRSGELDYLRGLVEAGRLRTVIARTFTLEETAEAHRLVDTGLAVGRVTITA